MSPSNQDVKRLADAFLACTAPLTQVLDDMSRAPELSPEPAGEVLRRLLCGALQPLAAATPADELRAATRLVDAAAELIADELYLVPPPPARRRSTRRTRGHG